MRAGVLGQLKHETTAPVGIVFSGMDNMPIPKLRRLQSIGLSPGTKTTCCPDVG